MNEDYCICARWKPSAESHFTGWERWTRYLARSEAINEGRRYAGSSHRLLEFGLFVRPENRRGGMPVFNFVRLI